MHRERAPRDIRHLRLPPSKSRGITWKPLRTVSLYSKLDKSIDVQHDESSSSTGSVRRVQLVKSYFTSDEAGFFRPNEPYVLGPDDSFIRCKPEADKPRPSSPNPGTTAFTQVTRSV